MQSEPDTVESSLVAVLSGTVVRGVVVGLLFAGFAYVYLFRLWEFTSGLLTPLAGHRTAVVVGVAPATVLLVVGLAAAEYSRRRYELTDEELVERRGVLWTRSTAFPYEEITDVHASQTRLQALFGVGTVRVNDRDPEETGDEEAMRLRFVERPEAVSERLREGSGADAVPRLTVEPDPLAAARTSAYRGLGIGLLAGFVPVALIATLLGEVGVSVAEGLLAGVGVVLLAVLARAVQIYAAYDGRRYEIYTDRVEDVGGVSTTVVAFEAVDDIEVYESLGRLALAPAMETEPDQESESDETATGGDGSAVSRDGSRGRIDLVNEDGETLLALRYVSEVERTRSQLETLVTPADGGE
jgi:membrane protein YdbS with pleckstrin-like domain